MEVLRGVVVVGAVVVFVFVVLVLVVVGFGDIALAALLLLDSPLFLDSENDKTV